MLNALLWNVPLTAGLAIVLTAVCRLPWMLKRPALRHLLWLLLLAKLIQPHRRGLSLRSTARQIYSQQLRQGRGLWKR